MNKRNNDILNDIISRGGDGGIPFFAGKYHVSERTIRNDLKSINDFLSVNQLPPLTIRSNGGIFYYGDKTLILDLIKNNDFYEYKLSKEEREIAFSLILLLSDGFTTLAAISEELFVSRRALINDLDAVKKLLQSQNLQIESHSNKGIRLLGPEQERRRCIISIVLTKLGLSSTELEQYNPFYNMILSLIDRNERDKKMIEQIIKTEERKNNLKFTDSSFVSLMYYMIVAIGRMRRGSFVEGVCDPKEEQLPLAKDILAYTTDYFKLPLKEGEIQFLSEILAGLAPVHTGNPYGKAVEIQVIATKFIRKVSEDLHIDLNYDYTFYENLEKHLQATLLNRFSSLPQNAIMDLIKQNYPDVMQITKDEIPILERYVRHNIDENEISYLAMHICAAIERKKGDRKRAKVIVVCGGGVGTSELLVERLKKRFDFEIISVIAAHNADMLKDAKADLIVSTVSLKNCGVDFLQVSPFLDDADYLKICKYLETVHPAHVVESPAERYGSDSLMKRLDPLLDGYFPEASEAAAFSAKLRHTLEEYFGEKKENGTAFLYQLLTPDKIRLDVECSNREEAIWQSAEVLLEQEYIERQYLEAILENLKENGPYFVLSPGFAVPHAGLGSGCKKMGMSLIRLKTPVPFENAEFDPIEFVCCLSAVDSNSHLKAFFNLVNLLRSDEFKKRLHASETPEEVTAIIRSYESSMKLNSERG